MKDMILNALVAIIAGASLGVLLAVELAK